MDLQVGQRVRLTGGPFPGHRGVVVDLTPGRPALVAIERDAPRGRYGERGSVPIITTHYVTVESLAPYYPPTFDSYEDDPESSGR